MKPISKSNMVVKIYNFWWLQYPKTWCAFLWGLVFILPSLILLPGRIFYGFVAYGSHISVTAIVNSRANSSKEIIGIVKNKLKTTLYLKHKI